MNEHTGDVYGRTLELQRKREEWEARKRAEAKHKEGEKKQAALESYLKRRGEDYMDHAGEQPTREDLAQWRAEYMDQIEREYQAEREAKLKAAEAEYPF
jgi:hypothetical protein